MKEVFAHRDSTRVGQAQSILEAEGILCFIRNDTSSGLMGGAVIGPPRLYDPALFVTAEEDFPRAAALIQDWLSLPGADPEAEDWVCAACGETVPGGYVECWSCQTPREPVSVA